MLSDIDANVTTRELRDGRSMVNRRTLSGNCSCLSSDDAAFIQICVPKTFHKYSEFSKWQRSKRKACNQRFFIATQFS